MENTERTYHCAIVCAPEQGLWVNGQTEAVLIIVIRHQTSAGGLWPRWMTIQLLSEQVLTRLLLLQTNLSQTGSLNS